MGSILGATASSAGAKDEVAASSLGADESTRGVVVTAFDGSSVPEASVDVSVTSDDGPSELEASFDISFTSAAP